MAANPQTALPHGHPFVFVDRVLKVEAGQRAVGVKNVTVDDETMRGHFPDNPIFAGVQIVEALAQVAGIALHAAQGNADAARTGLLAVRNMKFKKTVRAGDQLRLTATLSSQLGALSQFAVQAERGGEVVAEGELVMGPLQG